MRLRYNEMNAFLANFIYDHHINKLIEPMHTSIIQVWTALTLYRIIYSNLTARNVDYHRWLFDWSILFIRFGRMSRWISSNIRSGTNICRRYVVRIHRKWTGCVLQRDANAHTNIEIAKVRMEDWFQEPTQTRTDVRCEVWDVRRYQGSRSNEWIYVDEFACPYQYYGPE